MSHANSTQHNVEVLPNSYLKRFFAMTVVVLFIIASANAQDESNPQRGLYPGGSYLVSDIDTINTFNGNLMLNIPLASLPLGRGGEAGPGFGLTYNSKLWDIQKIVDPGEPGTGEGVTFYELEQSPNGGWRFNVPVYTINEESFIPSDTNCNSGYVNRLIIIFPDGSRHEMYPSGYTLKSSTQGKFARIRLDGWQATEFQIPGFCTVNYSLQTTNTITYYSIDGTYLRLDVLHDNAGTGINPWILYFPDGRRVETPDTSSDFPEFQRTFDRNNNYTQFETIHNYNGTGRTVSKLSDEFGRYILHDGNTITATGVNNEELTWTITWKPAAQPIINKTYCDHVPTGGGCDSFNDVNVNLGGVDQITLPAQLGGLSYSFSYNASAGGWGELSSITLPSGAMVDYEYEEDGQSQIFSYRVRDNRVARKDLTYQLEYDLTSTTTTDSWFYSKNPTTGATTITAPDNGITTIYHLGGLDPILGDSAKGVAYKTENPDHTVEENLWQTNTPSGITFLGSSEPAKLNAVLKAKFISITNSSGQLVKTAVTDYSYDKNGNITATREYDWVDYSSIQRDSNGRPLAANQQPALTSSLLKRLTTNSYFNPTPDASDSTTNDPDAYSKGTSARLRYLIAATEIGTGSQVQARSELTYDDPTLTGNITQTKRWDSTKGAYSNPLTAGNSIVTSNVYEGWPSGATGKLVRTTDARGIQTKFTYGAVRQKVLTATRLRLGTL